MEKKYYISKIEKEASFNINSIKNLASKSGRAIQDVAMNNPKKLGAGIAGVTGVGSAYSLLDKEDRNKVKSALKKGGRTYIDANVSGEAAEVVRKLGGLAGAGVALARGKRNPKDIIKSGIGGFAIADVGGSAVLPAVNLKRKMKKELNRTPTKEEYAKVIAGNAGGPAALWTGMYSLKKGRKMLNKMQGAGVDMISGLKKTKNDFTSGVTNLVENEGAVTSKRIKELMKTEEGKKVTQKVKSNLNDVAKKGLSVAAPLGVMDQVAQMPSYLATPKNITDKAKKETLEN